MCERQLVRRCWTTRGSSASHRRPPEQPLPRVVAIAPDLVPATATMDAFRELNLRLAQVSVDETNN